MKHEIPVTAIGPQGEAMGQAVSACVHCGFCLPACPTYLVLGEEMDSPRGRIVLMKETLEGHLPLAEITPYLDRCLGCLGCTSACPSGVEYGELLTGFRAWAENKRERPLMERVTRTLVAQTLPYPRRFRLAAAAAHLFTPLHPLLPTAFQPMLDLLPDKLPVADPLPGFYPAQGERRARVALLVGCVQQVLQPAINWATLHVLAANGIETIIPPRQGCCGSLAMHTGQAQQARALARHNLSVFPADVDALVTNAAGCGSGMKEYGLLFTGEPEAAQAEALARRTKDVSEFLAELGLRPPAPLPSPLKVAYHDACHLAHAQGVRSAPRTLLQQIPGLTLLEIPENDLCCGSAGTYNLEHPALAEQLGQRKANNVWQTAPEAVVMGNIGCMVQISRHLAAANHPLPVYHTMELLALAYGGRVGE
ncbi:MAG: glycolate oxidase subunit GlcF [Chloroflexi bacterium]|nr:glycolate oxidase subunit GlcF [Chloroflexota bacterium]MBP8059066.1 glycolate oxidase subunit GlcF [Chloroflexota bacterium]